MPKQLKHTVILTQIYPLIEKAMSKNYQKYHRMLNEFFEKRSKSLYDTCPCDRIFFGQEDTDNFFDSLGIKESDITERLRNVYYYDIADFNPRAAKDELTVACVMIIRYFYLKNKRKEAELATLYLAFSGKFYPSVHSGSFPKVPPSEHRYIMDYVINNKLTNKFDIKTEKNIIGAIRSKCITWLNAYDNKLKECDDEDVVYVIQQLRDRIKSFMINIASLYYEVYENKDAHFVYDSDNLNDDGYRLVDNDSMKIDRAVEQTMSTLNSKSIDFKVCKTVADANIKANEVKNIVESILSDTSNLPLVKDLIRCIITQYFSESKDKNIQNIDFISKSITPRPNSKDPNVIRQRELVELLLTEHSPAYLRRRKREDTQSSYKKALTAFFVLTIYNANK